MSLNLTIEQTVVELNLTAQMQGIEVTLQPVINKSTTVGAVKTVNGKIGDVILDANDVGAVPTSEVGQPDGVASLDSDGLLMSGQFQQVNLQHRMFDLNEDVIIGETYARGGGVQSLKSSDMRSTFIYVPATFIATSCVVRVSTGTEPDPVPTQLYLYTLPSGGLLGESELLHDLGEVNCQTPGFKTSVFSAITIKQGWYILAYKHISGTNNITADLFTIGQTAYRGLSQWLDMQSQYLTYSGSDFDNPVWDGNNLRRPKISLIGRFL
jgi:hypothetical protein